MFVNTAAEMLGYIEASVKMFSSGVSGVGGSGSSAKLNSPQPQQPLPPSLWDQHEVKGAVQALAERERADPFQEEESQPPPTSSSSSAAFSTSQQQQHSGGSGSGAGVATYDVTTSPYSTHAPTWPATDDFFLNTLLVQYTQQVTPLATTTDAGTSVSSQPLWTAPQLSEHAGMLWVMHLRAQCSLRGVRPSEVLGSGILAQLDEFAHRCSERVVGGGNGNDIAANFSGATASITTTIKTTTTPAAFVSAPAATVAVRMEFITQCLRQLVGARQPTGAVYVLAMRWAGAVTATTKSNISAATSSVGSATSASSVSLDAVRLRHLGILLAAGGGSRDEEAEQMVPQVSNLG